MLTVPKKYLFSPFLRDSRIVFSSMYDSNKPVCYSSSSSYSSSPGSY